ncbi:MAG: hypothetical protein WCV81_03080 [Microgenomates group bacterium]|jgi:hypothetical protein
MIEAVDQVSLLNRIEIISSNPTYRPTTEELFNLGKDAFFLKKGSCSREVRYDYTSNNEEGSIYISLVGDENRCNWQIIPDGDLGKFASISLVRYLGKSGEFLYDYLPCDFSGESQTCHNEGISAPIPFRYARYFTTKLYDVLSTQA